jgi:hypothetical protein
VDPDEARPIGAVAVIIVAVVPAQLLGDLLVLLGLEVFFRVKEIPGGQDAGADEYERKLTCHTGHGNASGRGAGESLYVYQHFALDASNFAQSCRYRPLGPGVTTYGEAEK